MAKLGIQLYTVRDYLEKDYAGTVRAIKKTGYDGVEIPGGVMEKMDALQLRNLLNEQNLALAGIVFDHNDLINHLEQAVLYCKESHCTTVLYPYIPGDLRRSEIEFRQTAEQIDDFGKTFASNGIRMLYHIHGYEFKTVGNVTGMDILLEYFKPGNVGLEIDVYWVEYGGVSAVKLVEQYARMSPYIHLKDYSGDFADTEVGCGSIDIQKIIHTGLSHGTEWFIVEQEKFDKDSMESARISFDNVRKLLKAEERQ